MKKLLLLIIPALMLISCDDARTYEQIKRTVIDIDTYYNDWEYVKGGAFYSCTMNVPALTRYAVRNGAAIAYIKYDNSIQILPSVRLYEMRDINDKPFQFTQTIDYEYRQGSITFYFTNSHFYYEDSNPGDISFRLVIME